jgi:hypothetical protein
LLDDEFVEVIEFLRLHTTFGKCESFKMLARSKTHCMHIELPKMLQTSAKGSRKKYRNQKHVRGLLDDFDGWSLAVFFTEDGIRNPKRT